MVVSRSYELAAKLAARSVSVATANGSMLHLPLFMRLAAVVMMLGGGRANGSAPLAEERFHAHDT
jgi:hypothetical protein